MRIGPFRRLRFYAGRLLTAEDLEAEQEYHRAKRRLQNRLLFGAGVVSGLGCTVESVGRIRVEAGVAVDCLGREIVVPAPQTLDVPDARGLFVGIRYVERCVDPTPVGDEVEASMIEEGFEIVLSRESFAHTHDPHGPRLAACGEDHPVLLRAPDGGAETSPP
ncbi:MAG: hypothetical protein R2991_13910 [Thermoanaerobaculia bacterium]